LEDADQPVRLEALLALLAIDDDYAAQVVADDARAGKHDLVAELLGALPRPLTRETFALVRSLLAVESATVQAAIRTLGAELCQGTFAEETRQALVRGLVPPVGGATLTAAPVTAAPAPAGGSLARAKLEFKFKREQVQDLTVFFIDIADFTQKSESDKLATVKLVTAFEDIVVPTVAANRGKVVKKMGDAILAVFKHPVSAVVAAMTTQQKIGQYSSMRLEQEKFQARIGLNTGDVTWKDNDVFGRTVNVASRMQNKADPGGILITEATWKQVREYVRCTELGPIQVKGITEAITAYSLEEILVDLDKVRTVQRAERVPVQAGSLERLRESMFVPEFRVPDERAGRPGVDLLREMFGEIAQSVGDLLPDSQEYDFKKYLQERWNELMRRL
jgi:class 3 adenylate cyclase